MPAVPSIYPMLGDVSKRTGIQSGLNTQLKNLGTQVGTGVAQRGSEYTDLSGGYRSLLNSPGYDPTQKAAITQSTLSPISQAYGGARNQLSRQIARTGNVAGYGSILRNLARGKAGAMASQNLQNQKDFADEQLRRKMLGLEGIANLYGVDTSFLNSMLGQQNQLLGLGVNMYGEAAQKQRSGFGAAFSQAVGSGLGGLLTLH